MARAAPRSGGSGVSAGAGAAAGALARGGVGLGSIAGIGAAALAVRTYASLSDEYKNLYARVSLTTTGLEQQKQTFDRIVGIATNTRQSLEGIVTTYYRLSQAAQQLGIEQEDAFVATELVAKAITVSGASAQSANAAIIQLGQGLASGTLRGDELRSVLEQTPRLAQAIAEGMGTTVGQLRILGQEGKITSETVIQAILTQKDVLETEFAQFPVTIGQAFTVLRTAATVAVGEIEQSTGVTAGFAQAIQNLGLLLRDPAVIKGLKDIVQVIGTGLKLAMDVAIVSFKAFIALLPVLKVALALTVTNFIRLRLTAIATAIAVRGGFAGMAASVVASMKVMTLAAAKNPFGALLTALGTLIALMIVFSDSTVQLAGKQIALGDIVTETFATVAAGIGKSIQQIAENWSWMTGGVKKDTKDATTTGLAFFVSFADNVINLFLTIGQSIGIIIANILGDIAKVGAAGAALLSGDFGRAAELGLSVKGISGTGKDLAKNAQNQFKQTYVSGILERAAVRTANARQTPLGGIARPGSGDPALATGGGSGSGGAAERAQETADKLKQLQSTYDPLIAKAREFDEQLRFLNSTLALGDAALRKMGLSTEQVERLTASVIRRRTEELDIMFDTTRTYNEQVRLFKVMGTARQDEQGLIELENKARSLNTELTATQTAEYRRQAAELRRLTALDTARTALQDAINTNEDEAAGLGRIGALRERAIARAQFINKLRREGVDIASEETQELIRQFDKQQRISGVITARNDLADRLTNLDMEIRLSGVLEHQRDRINSLLEYENYLKEQGLYSTTQGVEMMRAYAEAVDAAAAAELAARSDWLGGIQEGLMDLSEEWSNFRNQARGFVTDAFQSLSDSLTGFIETGKLSFRGFVQSISRGIIRAGVNGILGQATNALGGLFGQRGQAAGQPTSILDRYLQVNRAIPVIIQNTGSLGSLLQPGAATNDNPAEALVAGAVEAADIFKGGVGEAASGFVGFLQSLLGSSGGGILGAIAGAFFKDGGVMTEHGKLPLRKYSRGGVARSPQVAVFGEGSTPEAYVPVPSGRIPVVLSGLPQQQASAGNIIIAPQVTVSIPYEGRGAGDLSVEQGRELSKSLEQEMGKFLERWVQNEAKPGGRLARSRN
jgi:lambda family phage tail tape measure protein